MEAASSIPRSRRRAARHLACGLGLCALTATLLALTGSPASGAAAGGPAVVVDGPGGVVSSFDGEEIEGAYDVREGRTATLRADAGEAGEPIGIPPSLSAEGLIALAGGEPAATGYITVPRPNGTVAYLRLADLPGPPEGPASFWVDSGCTHFFRPAVGDGPNAEDNIASCGAPLAVGIRDGAVLAVRVTATPSTATAGQPIEFTAAAEGGEPGEEFSYVWSFGDGSTAEGARASHSFAATGSYRVRVTATGARESGGESAPVTVVVGSPPAGAGVGAGPEAPKQKKPHGTGGRRGGGATGGRGGKSGGSKHGGKAARPGSGSGAGRARGGEAGESPPVHSGAEPATTEPPPSEPTASQPSPSAEAPPAAGEPSPFSEAQQPGSPAPQRASSPTGPGNATPQVSPVTAPSEPAPASPESQNATAPALGRTVRGQLVADLFAAGSPEPGSGGSGADATAESFASAPPSGGGSIPVAALAAAVLLAAGVLSEWRRRPGRGLR